jgi:putative spermidine/putrescine transport system permease protein
MKKRFIVSKIIFFLFVLAGCSPIILLSLLTVSSSWNYPELLPQAFSIKGLNYVLFNNLETFKAIVTTLIIGLFSSLLTIAVSIPTARALVLYNFKGRKFIRLLVLLPLIVPSITVTTGVQISMIRAGLSGTLLGVSIIHMAFSLPYAIRILVNVFEIVGDSAEKQASTLGASSFQIFRNITLPMIMPGILSAFTICFTISLSQYVTTFLIGGGRIITIPILLIPYIQSGEVQAAAIYSLLFIVTALLSLVFIERTVKRYYVLEGLFYV